ncbi:MAG TPA: SDR family oxidoreductase [Polyangiales bacterium]|nr:SDR family oxidoreductase [Polyangiales bacterium]
MPSVLITGANRGLGLEFAKQYAEAGWRVFASARAISEELAQLGERHAQLTLHRLELGDEASVRALSRELTDPIDLLLNNAGTMGPAQQSVGKLDAAGMLETLRINTVAPLVIANAFLEQVARSERKLLIAVTSGMGSIEETSGGYHAYRASKAALNMTFRNLALDLRGRGVIAAVINPGWVQTDMGGRGAPTTVQDSIAKMRKVFDGLTSDDSGTFLDYKGGTLPW